MSSLSEADDFYLEMQTEATSLLEEFEQGSLVLVRQALAAVGGRSWDVTASGSPTRTTLMGVARPVAHKFIDGERITARSVMVVFAVPVGVTPAMTDQIEIDGRIRTTISMKQIPEAGTPVAYFAIVGD